MAPVSDHYVPLDAALVWLAAALLFYLPQAAVVIYLPSQIVPRFVSQESHCDSADIF
jgi:hypothetical protein